MLPPNTAQMNWRKLYCRQNLALLMPALNIVQLIPTLAWLIDVMYQHGLFFFLLRVSEHKHSPGLWMLLLPFSYQLKHA